MNNDRLHGARVCRTIILIATGLHFLVTCTVPEQPEANNLKDKQDVLFAFDDVSIEATRGVKLEMLRPEKHPNNPILERGKAEEPDEHRASFPTVIYDNGLWRMWYRAIPSHGDYYKSLMAYAESDDGITWRKPELGLSEFNGSKKNNLVKTVRGLSTVSVMYDKEAPPERRYVMAGADMSWYDEWYLDSPSTTRIDVSPDGLNWTPLKDEPGIIPQMNLTTTIYKFKGQYHIAAKQISPLLRIPMQTIYPDPIYGMMGPRTFVVWRSPTIDRWPQENTKSLTIKPMRSSSPYLEGWDREEVHFAYVTPYRNVCLGVYGQWHHPHLLDENGEARYEGEPVSIDLGLIISNDGLHFREPAPGFTLVARDQELTWDRDYRDNEDKDNIILNQGPMINSGRLTHLYYGASTPGGNVGGNKANIGLATWPRDRFGYLSLIDEKTTGQFVSCPLEYEQGMKLYVNADIPSGSSLQVYLLDEHGLDVLPGYGAADGGQVKESGLDVEVVWEDKPSLPIGQRFKIRCEIKGQTRVYALYLREQDDVE
jgi:hypothetical protein